MQNMGTAHRMSNLVRFKRMDHNQRYNFATQTLKADLQILADCCPEFFLARLALFEDMNAASLKGNDVGEAGRSEVRTTDANCGEHDQCSSKPHDNVPEDGLQINGAQNKWMQDVEENDVPIELLIVKTRGCPKKKASAAKVEESQKRWPARAFLGAFCERTRKVLEKLLIAGNVGESREVLDA